MNVIVASFSRLILAYVQGTVANSALIQGDSQNQMYKYCMLIQIYRIQKDDTNGTICRTAVEMDIEKRLEDTVGEREGGTD